MEDELAIASLAVGAISGVAGLIAALYAIKSAKIQKAAIAATQKQLKATIVNDIRDNFGDSNFRDQYKFLASWVKDARNTDQQWYKKIDLSVAKEVDLARDITSKYFTKIGINFKNGLLDSSTLKTIFSRTQAEFLICMLHPIQIRLPDYDKESPYNYALYAAKAAWPEEVESWRASNPILYDLYLRTEDNK